VHFDEDRVAHRGIDAILQQAFVGAKEIVAEPTGIDRQAGMSAIACALHYEYN